MIDHGASAVGARMRALRREKGWSLREFEERSRGQIKAITLGSYERGDRSLSVETMSLIADVLSIHPAELLSNKCRPITTDAPRHIYDLLALGSLKATTERELLVRFTNDLSRLRGDWRGAVISIRQSDVANLALLFSLLPNSNGDATYFYRWVNEARIRLEKN
jgi:transcriptional regulator with XRE-family HTH domain